MAAWCPAGVHEGLICPCINESTERQVLEGPAIPATALGGGNNTQFAELMKGATRASALVLLAYALRLDRLAFTHLLRTGYYLLRNRLAIGSAMVGLWYFAQGLALGPLYRLKQPPRLALTA